ncbi:MAG: prepilin peptidase [Eubacteriales bacterium]|nr:prepilin peptidase [Eubacteriales bacterium]
MEKYEMLEKSAILFLLLLEAGSDMKRREIHLPATLVLWGIGAARVIYQKEAVVYLIAALLPGLILLFLSMIAKGEIGAGDGIVLLGLGLWVSAEQILQIVQISFGLCGIYAVSCLILFKKEAKYEIPFLVFLLAGYILGGVFAD